MHAESFALLFDGVRSGGSVGVTADAWLRLARATPGNARRVWAAVAADWQQQLVRAEQRSADPAVRDWLLGRGDEMGRRAWEVWLRSPETIRRALDELRWLAKPDEPPVEIDAQGV